VAKRNLYLGIPLESFLVSEPLLASKRSLEVEDVETLLLTTSKHA
jgi:hypothetical protein